jgi:hypothetical protein
MPCNNSAKGTPKVGTRIHGNVVIVDMPNLGEVINPKLTVIIKSAIPRTFQTTRAYLDQPNPLLRKYANGIAVAPTKMSPTPAGILNAGCKIPWDTPHKKDYT